MLRRFASATAIAMLIAMGGAAMARADGSEVVCNHEIPQVCVIVATDSVPPQGFTKQSSGPVADSGAAPDPRCMNVRANASSISLSRRHTAMAAAGFGQWIVQSEDGTEQYFFWQTCPSGSRTLIFIPPVAPGESVPAIPADVIAARAVSDLRELNAIVPIAHFHTDGASVNTWTYLWIDNPGPQSATAAAGAVSVTATATLSSVTWSMGEPVPGSTFTCEGSGQDPGDSWVGSAQLDPNPGTCHYAYRLVSTDERTNGARTWPVTVTANWSVVWTANTGESGTDALTPAANTQIAVGEWESVLVCC